MLQQTTVATVKGYFSKFLNRWPTINDLASASQDELMQVWQGLGYYSRARNLHKTAKIITEDYQGIIPNSYAELIKLPGLGPYTAAAIASIAFKEPVIAIDTNVNRVLCRLFAVSATGSAQKKQIQDIANQLTHTQHSDTLSQALMDVGSSFCKANNPKCDECFFKSNCLAFSKNVQNTLPQKPTKPIRPKRYAHTFVMRYKNQICIEKRPEKGLLAGLYQFPTSEFSNISVDACYPFPAKWQHIGIVRHIFSHFELELVVWEAFIPISVKIDPAIKARNVDVPRLDRGIHESSIMGNWVALNDLNNYGLPTMFKKALTYVKI